MILALDPIADLERYSLIKERNYSRTKKTLTMWHEFVELEIDGLSLSIQFHAEFSAAGDADPMCDAFEIESLYVTLPSVVGNDFFRLDKKYVEAYHGHRWGLILKQAERLALMAAANLDQDRWHFESMEDE